MLEFSELKVVVKQRLTLCLRVIFIRDRRDWVLTE